MIKKYIYTIFHIMLLILLGSLLLVKCMQNSQSIKTVPGKLTFCGEYSQNGSDWIPLEEETQLSALKGELILRGNFGRKIPEEWLINFYMNHVECCIYVNGVYVFSTAAWEDGLNASMCASDWSAFLSPGIMLGDVVEIHLRNYHRFGNSNAYMDFLDSFFIGPEAILKTTLAETTFLFRAGGFLVSVLSVGVLGTALAFSCMRFALDKKLWALGLLSLGMGGYILLDVVDVSLWSNLRVFNTYGSLLCMMLAAAELGTVLETQVTGKVKKIVQATVVAEFIWLSIICVMCLANQVLIYDTLLIWTWLMLIICPLQLACCIYECWMGRRTNLVIDISCICLLIGVIAELFNAFFVWWTEGLIVKCVFMALFIFNVARGMILITAIYQKAVQTDKLEEDLKNSRIIMAMNQIKTHFIFNILNAISGMCKYDPEKADDTIVRFSRYLRTNIDIMQGDQPVTFHSALRHLDDYIALEQIRFGDRIHFVTEIEADQFMIPPLILQPIVENSIKHGLTPKPGGGTVMLRTWTDGRNVFIAISDDGVGVDVKMLDKDKSVGLKNVRFRLRHIMQGELKFESTPGYGTTVTISIPCEEVEKCM